MSAASIRVLDSTATDDDLLDEASRILSDSRELWMQLEWLTLLANRIANVELRLTERLLEAKSLRRPPGGFLATRQLPLPPELQAIGDRRIAGLAVSAKEQDCLIEHLQRRCRGVLIQQIRAILLKGDHCDDRLRLLFSLADATKLLGGVCERDELQPFRSNLAALAASDPLSVAVQPARWSKLTRTGRVYEIDGVESPPWAR